MGRIQLAESNCEEVWHFSSLLQYQGVKELLIVDERKEYIS